MSKVDSFLRESQRINGQGTCAQSITLFRTTNADPCFNSVTMSRVALKDFTFSSGIVIPAGTTVAVPMYAIHHDKNIWPDPFKFDPYRSSRVQDQDAGGVKHQMVTSSPEFLPWGYGRHAWYVTMTVLFLPFLFNWRPSHACMQPGTILCCERTQDDVGLCRALV